MKYEGHGGVVFVPEVAVVATLGGFSTLSLPAACPALALLL